MPFRILLVAAALVVALVAACGETAAPVSTPDETARRDASHALDAVDELRADLEDEVSRLRRELRSAEGSRADLLRRIGRLSQRLDRTLQQMAGRLDGLAGAAESAESALSEARAVARDLAVLDERLDYHVKSHRGG